MSSSWPQRRPFPEPPLGRLCHCEAIRLDTDSILALEEGFQRLRLAPAATLLRKHLNKRVFTVLKYKCTPLGANFYDLVRVGMLHHDSMVGALAPDQYAYDVYSILLDPLLDDRHFGFELTDIHPADDWGYRQLKSIRSLDPDGKYIISTRVRCSRNLDGYHFTPTMSADELKEVERLIVELLYRLPWEYKGKYLPLQCIPRYLKMKMARAHCYFDEADRYELTGQVRRYWPIGRGIFVNSDHTFVVFVNEKDHLRVIALEKGEQLVEAYKHVACATPVLDRRLVPAVHERLGYLTVCPGDVGTGLRISVLMRIPERVPREPVADIAKTYRLEIRYMDHMAPDIVCVSNLRTLGCTQFEILKDFHHGLRELIMATHFYSMKMNKIPEETKAEVEAESEEDIEAKAEAKAKGRVCPEIEDEYVKEVEKAITDQQYDVSEVYELEAKALRKTKECIREANRRRVARDRAFRRKMMKEGITLKDRIFPRRKKAVPQGDTKEKLKPCKRMRFKRHINDRKCVSEDVFEAGGIGFLTSVTRRGRRSRSRSVESSARDVEPQEKEKGKKGK